MKRGCKKAQISVFIIVAIVVVAVIGIVIYLGGSSTISDADKAFFSQQNIKPEVDNIRNSILSCADETTKDSLRVIGIQGGYYKEPKDYYDVGDYFIPYYYNEGEFLMPSKKEIERQLEDYVDNNLRYCLDELNFNNFKLKYRIPETNTRISEKEEVIFTIDLPIIIEREGKRMLLELNELPVSQESYLYRILEVAKYITDSHKDDPDMICINCVADMAFRRELYVDFIEFRGDTETLVMITENKTMTEPYVFEFLNKYSVESEV